MERLGRRSVHPRRGRKAFRDPRSRGGVVPLVPRHGKDDLCEPASAGIAGVEISAGPRRPGRQPGSREPLWRLGLAGDDRVRPRRHRDRQDQGLYRAGADAGPAQGHHRRSLARTFGRRGLRGQTVRLGLPQQAGTRRTDEKFRRILGRQARRLGREPEIHRRRQHGPCDHPRRGRRCHRDQARAADAGRRDRADRSGVGRRVPVFRNRLLDPPAFRKDHVVPGAVSAAIQPGLRAVEGPEIPRGCPQISSATLPPFS